MSRLFPMLILVTLTLVVSACGGPATPHSEPLQALPTDEPTGTIAVKLADYVASDPALVGASGRPQVIVFFTFSSATCQAMRPIIHALQDEYGFMVDFIYLDMNAQNTKALQKQFAVTGAQPTIVFMDVTGQESARLVGQHTRDEVENLVQSLVAVG
jgi:thiol-disulfide isomerase/thioredoxin